MSVYIVAMKFRGLTPHGFHDTVLPKSSRSDFLYSPLAEINNDPSKIRLTPKIRYAKFSNCKSPVIPPGLIIPMGA